MNADRVRGLFIRQIEAYLRFAEHIEYDPRWILLAQLLHVAFAAVVYPLLFCELAFIQTRAGLHVTVIPLFELVVNVAGVKERIQLFLGQG